LISNEDCAAIYGENCIDIAGGTGSIPVVPTIIKPRETGVFCCL
jgi:hypothetical protein